MAATGLAGRLRRLLPPSRARVPAGPPLGEVAAASIAGRLQPYIGELPLNPRQPSRYADRYRDEGHALQNLSRHPAGRALPGGPRPAPRRRHRAALDGRARRRCAGRPPRQRTISPASLQAWASDAVSRQLLHGVWYGYAIAEALWAREADRVVLDRLVVRAPDRFRWSAEGQPLLRTETQPLGTPLPGGKFVVLRRPGEHGDLPHGPGLARWCFWPVWLKRHGLKFWSVALEKFGAPGVKGTYPRNASAEQKADLLDLVQSFATNLGVILPEGQGDRDRRERAPRRRGFSGLRRLSRPRHIHHDPRAVRHHRHGALARHRRGAARRARRDRRRRLPPAR